MRVLNRIIDTRQVGCEVAHENHPGTHWKESFGDPPMSGVFVDGPVQTPNRPSNLLLKKREKGTNMSDTNTNTDAQTKLKGAQLNALISRLKDGKPLTHQQMKFCEEMMAQHEANKKSQPTGTVKTPLELAEKLGVSKQLINYHRKRPTAPAQLEDGSWDVAAWHKYFAAVGKIQTVAAQGGDDEGSRLLAAKAEQVLLQNDKIRFNLNVAKETYIPKVLAQQVFGKLTLSLKSRCYSSLVRFVTLARLAKDTTDGVEELRKEMDAIFMSVATSKWMKP